MEACADLLEKGIHPTNISESFHIALMKCMEILKTITLPVELTDRDSLLSCVNTSLSSKVVSGNSDILSPIAVDSVLKIIDPKMDNNVDLRDIKICKSVSGTIEDTEMIDGLVFSNNKISHAAGGPSKIKDPKIALIQFCLSAPKTDVDQSVVVKDYSAMDRIMREERKYIAGLVSKVVKSGANVVLVQKSILREATSELSEHFLAKKGIMLIKDIERDDVAFICKTIKCTPIAHIDQMTPEKLGTAKLIEEVQLSDESKIVKCTGLSGNTKTVSILVRGSNKLIVDEAERSLHDALCVVRAIVKSRGLVCGGGAPEIEMAYQLNKYARTLKGAESICVRSYADALEVIPYTLAENAGLSPINVVTELRNKHAKGEKNAGISLRRFGISDNIGTENVLQPALIT